MKPERRAIVSIVAAVSVLVVVTVIIFIFGVIPLPDFPSLAEQPDPSIPGTVAYVAFDDDPCLVTVPASGGGVVERVWCGRQYVEFPSWTADGLLVVVDYTAQPSYLLIDPTTGTAVDRIPQDNQPGEPVPLPYPSTVRQERPDGARVRTDGLRGGEASVIVRINGEDQTILTVENAPSDYSFIDAQWSPDGAWVLVSDTAGRLLIVGADGNPAARVLVDGLQEWGAQAAWYIPGNGTYTVEIPGR
ncbi:MAG: hypothetical protein RI637_13585 [Acidimicrobiia bacterium]|nr:hypothetical protein [Acidimicrobiia bacterium]